MRPLTPHAQTPTRVSTALLLSVLVSTISFPYLPQPLRPCPAAAETTPSFDSLGRRGQALADEGTLAGLRRAVGVFRRQRKATGGRRQAFTAYNNIAVTLLRLGNARRRAWKV